ncbi:MAG: NAD(P)/FAD-dependent oxidoreductase [Gammaproteobacteria bacterium]|nr:MAG: NAD(P)/FAD-dependent oxidoreductase [Gammaproteobacteria bacterium]
MDNFDVIVVGGGPAGSASAGALVRAGRRVVVLDREEFPRLKLCAGWVTPGVFKALGIEPEEYPRGLHAFDHLVVHVGGLTFRLPTRQYSVRRLEFDDFLLQRSQAAIIRHEVREIVQRDETYIIDDAYSARYLVGAGGTRCPVYRTLFRHNLQRDSRTQIAALELEFPCLWRDPRCHLWFFERCLPGYSWYVPKSNGMLNIGIGAMAEHLKQKGQHLHAHWEQLIARLCREGLLDSEPGPPSGYSYYLRASGNSARLGNALLVGDAVGVASRDLGEGIGPAIRSGLSAAESILTASPYRPHQGSGLSFDEILHNRLLRLLGRAAFRMLGITGREISLEGR